MNKNILLSILLSVFVLLFLPINSLTAQESILEPDYKVDHIASRTEKIKEKIGLILRVNKTAKINYQIKIIEKRLAELYWAVENDVDSIETAASRYSTYIGNLELFLETNRDIISKDQILNTFNKHKEIISNIQSKFERDSGWWLSIQHNLNTIDILSDKIRSF